MKDFIKYTFATVAGIFVFGIIMFFMTLMSIISMVASSESTKSVKDNSVLVLNLSGALEEQAEDNVFGKFMGNANEQIGLDDVLSAIEKAKNEENIKGIYIEAGLFSADSWASLQAIRRSLTDFRKSGKWIVAYGDGYTQASYYLASTANKVYLNPQGMLDWHGMAATPMYLKDLMAKFGIKMQLAKVGTYKSAPEMFTASQMSDANREQVTAYITGIWNNVLKDVSASRKISIENLNAYADNYVALEDPQNLVKMKMVDGLLYTDQIKEEVKKLLKLEKDDDINQLSVTDMKDVPGAKQKGDEIAVYYAFGDIVDGQASNPMGNGHNIDAQEVCKDLENLMNDDDVKAVVLRINSGGGSAYASEQIWHSVTNLKAKKPVVVSMGGMAASGGYYIACNSNYIFAEPTTLTGSIGIFGMFPDFSELLTQKLGVKFDEVKTNKHSAFGTSARPFNEEEMALLDTYINRGYKLFRKRVADGRKLTTEQVEAVAQGHVWLGQDALKHKLVDKLGGLDEAVAKAAELAKSKEYHTNSYPAPKDWTDQFLESMSKGNYLDQEMRAALGEYYEPFMMLKNMNKVNAIQTRIPYIISIK